MSLTLKLTSLFIRTTAKPIANYIKSQAREHDKFRRYCIAIAQRLHRLDMRLRLGLLQDVGAIDRQIAREAAEAEKKAAQKASTPTVKTKEQSEADEARRAADKKKIGEKVKSEKEKEKDRRMRMVRPLSEAKAIDSGANFISETFLFMVAGGLIVFETMRSRRKEASRREDVRERLEELEGEVRRLRGEGEKKDVEVQQAVKVETPQDKSVEEPRRGEDTTKQSSVKDPSTSTDAKGLTKKDPREEDKKIDR